jgi:hypothetical protein
MKKNTKTVQYDHPGRPQYNVKWPTRKEFTFLDILSINGVNTDPGSKTYGKGPNCSLLTIRKGLERDMYFHKPGKALIAANRTRVNPRSEVCLIHGVTAEPNSDSGLGRRAKLYCLRVNKDNVSKPAVKVKAVKAVKAPRKARTPKVTSQTPTADALDAIHKVLATPDPVPALTVPAVTIAPSPAPVSAPVPPTPVEANPAPAPVAPAAVTPEAAPAVEAPAAPVVPTLVNS